MNDTSTDVRTIPVLGHDEAMRLASDEYAKFLDLISSLRDADWSKPTDCTLWDVRSLVAHNHGIFEASASVREMARQQLKAARRAKREAIAPIDAMTAIEVEERADLTGTQLVERIATTIPRAVAGRTRIPAVFREKAKLDLGDGIKRPLGYLLDRILTRDAWMHRVDLSRATDRELVLTSEHDGRLVADVVGEWATNHGQPFTLHLAGPAGGTFVSGSGGETLELDAVEFCRILSGRASGTGLLETKVMF